MTFWFHPEALAEYDEASLRYKDIRPRLGRNFVNAVENAIEVIVEHPTRYPETEPGIHRYLLKRFPYKIFFNTTQQRSGLLSMPSCM